MAKLYSFNCVGKNSTSRRENLAWAKLDPRIAAAGWPTHMSRPLAAKSIGACLKHVLNTRLTPVRLVVEASQS